MKHPYGLISDLHAHNWDAFSSIDEKGRNTRLMQIIAEIGRCCSNVLSNGGHKVVIGGDVFHVRGSVAPAVFNPLKEAMRLWCDKGIQFWGIAGNHDLSDKSSMELGSSVCMLAMPNYRVNFYHEPRFNPYDKIAYVPWVSNPSEYMKAIEGMLEKIAFEDLKPNMCDLICHIGIDGTLTGVPAHGVTPQALAAFGFKRVFSGHYHHHRDFGDGVFSIGATTHQTWSDVGTKAGFMLVWPDREQFFASHAPRFIDLSGSEDEDDLPLIVDGHFIRARVGAASAKQVSDWREHLLKLGAKGVIIQSIPADATSKREGVSVKSINSLEASVHDYVTERGMPAAVGDLCATIMQEVRV